VAKHKVATAKTENNSKNATTTAHTPPIAEKSIFNINIMNFFISLPSTKMAILRSIISPIRFGSNPDKSE
jgi:hypothetical protein